MTKEEELRQLEELRRIQAEERRKMQLNNTDYFEDSAFAPDNSYLNDSAFTDSAFTDSAFSDNSYSDSAFNDSAFTENKYNSNVNHNQQYNQNYNQPVNQQQQINIMPVHQQNPMNQQPQYHQRPDNSQQQYHQRPVNSQQQYHQRPANNQQQQYHQRPANNQQQQYHQRPANNQQQQYHQRPVNNQQQQFNQPVSVNADKRQRKRTDNRQNIQQMNGYQQFGQQEYIPDNNINTKKKRNNSMDDRPEKKYRKKKKKKHVFLKVVIAFLILIIGLCGLGVGLLVKSINKMERVETNVSKRTDNFSGGVYNILLIGQDAREGEGMQRADTIILCTINKTTHTVTLTSIMRDMYVNIPGYGGNRINAAFAFGGIDLLDQTIEENLGVKIDGNALVDFGGFMEAMTSVGNLDIELNAEEAAYLNEHPELGTTDEVAVEVWNLHEGVNNLTPGQVLGYSRIRHVGNSDWDRTNRQRTVIMAVIDKIKHGHLIKGFKVLDGVAPHIITDMSTGNILKAGFAYIRCGKGGMQSYYLPAEGTYQATYVDGMAVLLPDIEANKQVLQQYMQGIDPAAQ